ncbi:MAG: hypothetical protein ACXWJC_02385 [Croceibacterium sp.]
MTFKVLLAAALVVAVSAPALADEKAKDNGTAAPAQEKKVCRTETVTGSLVAKRRICLTQAQWDEMAANTRKDLNNLNRSENLGGDSGSANGANNTAGL